MVWSLRSCDFADEIQAQSIVDMSNRRLIARSMNCKKKLDCQPLLSCLELTSKHWKPGVWLGAWLNTIQKNDPHCLE